MSAIPSSLVAMMPAGLMVLMHQYCGAIGLSISCQPPNLLAASSTALGNFSKQLGRDGRAAWCHNLRYTHLMLCYIYSLHHDRDLLLTEHTTVKWLHLEVC